MRFRRRQHRRQLSSRIRRQERRRLGRIAAHAEMLSDLSPIALPDPSHKPKQRELR